MLVERASYESSESSSTLEKNSLLFVVDRLECVLPTRWSSGCGGGIVVIVAVLFMEDGEDGGWYDDGDRDDD